MHIHRTASFGSHILSFKVPYGSTVFPVLCPSSKARSVIGKCGNIISQIRQETGVKVRVEDTIPGCDERVIFIVGSDKENGVVSEQGEDDNEEEIEKTEEADNPKEHEDGDEDKKRFPVGDLESEKGTSGSNVIKQMSSESGAEIHILPRDKLPGCASSSDELVQLRISRDVDAVRKALKYVSQQLLENPPRDSGSSSHSFVRHPDDGISPAQHAVLRINGDLETVQEALMQITSRLYDHLFCNAFSLIHHHHGFPDQGPLFPLYVGMMEFSPPPFGLPPHCGFHPHDDHLPFMHHRPGFPSHIYEGMPSLGPWGPQVVTEVIWTNGRSWAYRTMDGLKEESVDLEAIITNTIVEVVVPRLVVPVIYGEDGGCLKHICEISNAKITTTDLQHGATETMIITSGTSEQTHAAQSLVQAFVISEIHLKFQRDNGFKELLPSLPTVGTNYWSSGAPATVATALMIRFV
ncbi:hypothetical protein LguiB_019849 [Lonicera macranthoides]